MSDTFGGISVPVAAPVAGFPAGDPALKYVADFVKAVLVARCATAWASVAGTESICKTAFYHDPTVGSVSYSDCPSVHVWRSVIGTEQMADDWTTQESTLRVLWLMHPADQDKRITQTPMFGAIAKVLRSRLYRGRDPSWKITGDPDTLATTRGSYLHRWCSFDKIEVGAATPADIMVEGADGSRHAFEGLVLELTVTESLIEDSAIYGTEPYLLNGAVGIAEDGEIPGDGFESTWAAGAHPIELIGTTPEAIEADSPDMALVAGRLVASVPGRLDPDTYTATGTGAARPTLEAAGWNASARSLLFAANDALDLDALADVVEGDDTAFSIAIAVQFAAHAAGALLWNFTDSAGASYFRAYSAGAGGTITTARCDAAATALTAAGTTVIGTDRAIVVWSFDGADLTTHVNGAVELADADLDVGSLTLDTFTVGGASTVSRSIAAVWLFPGEALTDANAVLVTAALAERWPIV